MHRVDFIQNRHQFILICTLPYNLKNNRHIQPVIPLGQISRIMLSLALSTQISALNTRSRPSGFPFSRCRYSNPNFFIQVHIYCGIHSALEAIGGYVFPSLVTVGVQVHHFSLGMPSMTLEICLPQPHQESFSEQEVSFVRVENKN